MTGLRIADAQTGLRAYPPRLLPWLLACGADRFGYELRLLLRAAPDDNASSHFRPLVDSLRIYLPLLACDLGAARLRC